MSDIEQLIRSIVRDELAKAKPANDDAPELVTVAAYARSRSVSESTVRQAIAENRLQHVRIGRSVRVPMHATIRSRGTSEDEITRRARLVLLGGRAR